MEYTKFENIYSFFLNTIQDYSIKKLFESDIETATQMLEYFLMKAIPKFRNCEKNILDVDLNNSSFNCTLDLEEITILSDLMVLSWMDRVINDITQMNMSLTDNDFKHYSEERNLAGKSEYRDRWRENTSQAMVDYGLYRTPFSQWAVGNYGV